MIALALEQPELSPRELAVRFTDEEKSVVSEASVYRLLKAHDLITSPAYIVVKAADEFRDKTTAPNQLWQTDFTYLKVTSWGWYYLSTVLDDFSRFVVAWKLCATMRADDVTATLDPRPERGHPRRAGPDQAADPGQPPLAAPRTRRLISPPDGPDPPLLSRPARLKSPDDGQPSSSDPHASALGSDPAVPRAVHLGAGIRGRAVPLAARP